MVAAGASIAAMAPRTTSRAGARLAATWKQVIATSTPVAAPPSTPATPTPAFASFRGVKLHLPVAPASITVLAFHQSSYNDSYRMKPLVRIGSQAAAAKAAKKAKVAAAHPSKGVASSESRTESDARGVWVGSALELWRSGRHVNQDTAIDCGAHPGTPVISPVNGTVMEIRPYHLYGKYPDIEIHIRPDAWIDVDVVILHTTDPTVTEGEHVLGGITPVSHVRRLSGVVPGLQLATYSADGGNHTHVQVNKVKKPGQPWIVGEDPPGMIRLGN